MAATVSGYSARIHSTRDTTVDAAVLQPTWTSALLKLGHYPKVLGHKRLAGTRNRPAAEITLTRRNPAPTARVSRATKPGVRRIKHPSGEEVGRVLVPVFSARRQCRSLAWPENLTQGTHHDTAHERPLECREHLGADNPRRSIEPPFPSLDQSCTDWRGKRSDGHTPGVAGGLGVGATVLPFARRLSRPAASLRWRSAPCAPASPRGSAR